MDRRRLPVVTGAHLLTLAVGGLVAGMAAGCQSQGSEVEMQSSARHACKGMNSCKGQGGCSTGNNGCAGKNSCKGKGGCAVPVKH